MFVPIFSPPCRYNMNSHLKSHQGIRRKNKKNHHCFLCDTSYRNRERCTKHLTQDHKIDIAIVDQLYTNGFECEESQRIIEEIKQNPIIVETEIKYDEDGIDEVGEEEEVFIEFIDADELGILEEKDILA